jgi:hypothetical protein
VAALAAELGLLLIALVATPVPGQLPNSPPRCTPAAVVIEGMGRAVHTNYFTRLQCDALKLAMIKNRHLAQTLFKGNVYDCVCRFDEGQEF